MSNPPLQLSPLLARRILLRAAGLAEMPRWRGLSGAQACLERLGEVQLDPIDRIGTNADLVFGARVDGLRRGDWGRLSDTFEHFSKERCLLPGRRFAAWRSHAAQAPWWRLSSRLERLPAEAIDGVWAEVRDRGPLTARQLSDHGAVRRIDWSGWKGTGKAGTMALEVLWTRCRVVVSGRTRTGERIYDLPERSLSRWVSQDNVSVDFFEDGLDHRIAVAGLLRTAGGPQWSALSPMRKTDALARRLADGRLVQVQLAGSRRAWLTTPAMLAEADTPVQTDERVRILGPLDPLMWDRPLIKLAFGFDYVWEVYKPRNKRQWGYYVCPLLWRGQLVGRVEAHRGDDGQVVVDQLWWEDDAPRPPRSRLRTALERWSAFQERR